MKYCFDIDNTICSGGVPYEEAKPFPKVVKRINELYDEGHHIIISTSRGHWSGENWLEFTKKQLDEWGCKYDKLSVGKKPHYDLLICDKTMRIEEIMVEDEIFE